MDEATGMISPGGVGYDINCGVRLVATDLAGPDVVGRLPDLARQIYRDVPAGVGEKGMVRLAARDLTRVLARGARWAVEEGYGEEDDLAHTESGGMMDAADPDLVSDHARERGAGQVGTLGSGNHFIEIGVVETIHHAAAADAMGLREGQVTVLLHSGSRGLGHQVCDDSLHAMASPKNRLDFDLPDRQLACAPFRSRLGQDYFGRMAAAANFAWANRQVMMHFARAAFERVLSASPRDLSMRLVYDVSHNIAKVETHEFGGKKRRLVVHRKGATRAFGPGHPDVPEAYRAIGQPVLVPGDMGRYSYVLVGTQGAMEQTFGSTCHGAGRRMSRHAAKKAGQGRDIAGEMADRGVFVLARDRGLLAEEMSEAYKDVADVVRVCDGAGISRVVAKLRPLAVVKG
jgi:tRNA-splicing ligase RtcB